MFFYKHLLKEKNLSLLRPSEKLRAYTPDSEYKDNTYGHSYCDVVLCDVKKLRNNSWTFLNTERENQIQAHTIFRYMPFMADGFIFYCPEVPCYRNKKIFLASKIAQKKFKGDISRFISLTHEQSQNFTRRDINIWPIAENHLESNHKNIKKPFIYQDYRQSIALKYLYEIERGIYRAVQFIINKF